MSDGAWALTGVATAAQKGTTRMDDQARVGPRLEDSGVFMIVLLLAVFDGADLASIGLAMSRLSRQLSLTPIEASTCASAGLAGLLIGALVCGRLADVIGRKPLLMATALLLGVFSLITTRVTGYGMLLGVRLFAGLGMGGLYPLLITLCHAAATPRFRSTAISLLVASAAVGSLLVSFVAMAADWRAIFYVGGAGPLLVLPLIAARRSLAGETAIAEGRPPPLLTVLFGDGRALGTAAVCISAFCTALTIFCMITWLPSLLLRGGVAEAATHFAIVAWSVGSIIGNLIAGWAVDRGRGKAAYVAGYAGAVIALGVMSAAPVNLASFLVIGVISLCVSGAQLVSFSLAPSYYPGAGRGTGVGAMVSCGRAGSICGPLLAGAVLGAGHPPAFVFLALLPCVGLSLLAALVFLGQLRGGGGAATA